MSTTVLHTFKPMPRNDKDGRLQAVVEARVTFHEHAIVIHFIDSWLATGLELVGEIEIIPEGSELLLRASTNRQLDLELDGEPQLVLYDAATPYHDQDEP